MKQIVIPYRPRELQNFLHKKCDNNRFNVIIVHRRGGKTVFSINHLIRAALMNKKPYPRYAFISPYRLQGKATAWDYLKQYSATIPSVKFNESELRVDFSINSSRIQIIGAENSNAIRGQYFDGIIVDETQNVAPDLFDTILRPCLSDRGGFAIFIGTPRGRNYFYELHENDVMLPKITEIAFLPWKMYLNPGAHDCIDPYVWIFLSILGVWSVPNIPNARILRTVWSVPNALQVPSTPIAAIDRQDLREVERAFRLPLWATEGCEAPR